ncbi:HdeD family acid-resistance protein [Sinorhizobium terangae]|uniref:HdeD family acid-resistance protein n=2 Tax=Sinorhizobium terangae TaxID=110322 RepID=A0A6N7LF86_SINTE|nr:HdeD family acid-resistance protein [Sinorhizobium terangae]MQX15869.1 HdeD family acid-resistance protein [Sinorhizobium terangae]
MASYETMPSNAGGAPGSPPTSVRVVLGGVMLLAGLVVLADAAFAPIVTPAFIGTAAILVGIFEIVHAFVTRQWGALSWQTLLGFLYIALGLALADVAGSSVIQVLASFVTRSARTHELFQTYAIGLLFIFSGIVRMLLSISHWREAGWTMMLSGVFGAGAGLVILAGFPKMALWVLALLLGTDFLAHGVAWLRFAYFPRPDRGEDNAAPPPA